MPRREISPQQLRDDEDWAGNNVAVTCPACSKVYLVSGFMHRSGRACPKCGKSKVVWTTTRDKNGTVRLEW